MEIGETIKYRQYTLTRHLKDDFVVEVGHDTLKEAKDWIDHLIDIGELEEVTDDKRRL